jgi:dipeptidyl aminopeptidase/acylaminoacyl peptidase
VTDWSPDDRRVAAVEYVSVNETYVHLVDVATGETETVTPRDRDGDSPTVAYGDVRWSGDGESLYWTTDLGSEFRRLARYDLATKRSTPLTAGIPWDVEEFDLSEDGSRLALVANEGGVARVHVLDTATGRELPAPDLPAGQITGLAFREGSHEVGFTLSSARSTADAYSFDLDAARLERWTESETAGLDPATFPEPDLIHYDSFDGRAIPAFVYRPAGDKFPGRRPVLIDIHGGPEGQFRPGFLGRTNHLINGLGLVLVFPNVRGSSGYGKTYLKLDNGKLREDAVKDIGALLDWIDAQPGLDAGRVGVVGGSYGGFMSLATQAKYNDRIKAGIDIVGISNFVTFLEHTQEYRRDLRRAEYGDERDPSMRAHLERISPLTNAAQIRTPLLVVQGKNDPRVPVTESEQIAAAVRNGGGPVWYVLGKDEGHGFARKPNQDYLQAVEVLFWRRYLLGEGDLPDSPAPRP